MTNNTINPNAAKIARIAGAEGIVLLKNNNVLPFDKSKTLSIFGRTFIDYFKCGTGSGGLVNTEYTVNILEGLEGRIKINEELVSVYKSWFIDNPYEDPGDGWFRTVKSQAEMPVSDELCALAAEKSDYALVCIGRTAGEENDSFAEKGCFLLSDTEEEVIKTVCRHFDKVCVVLNTGNIIDMKWVEKYNVPAVLYCWHGGMEGGNSLADILLGDVTPSGHLTDTIAYDISDYPSSANHGNHGENRYVEDIYVGYRYFETFAKEKVLFPFGFGLSYTKFDYGYSARLDGDTVRVSATVKNIGSYSGKAVVQVYYGAPQGRLGQPEKQLIGYKKTSLLSPGESEDLEICFDIKRMASYDDRKSYSFILEEGNYRIYAGDNVRDSLEVLNFDLDFTVVKKVRQALAPTRKFKRIKPRATASGYEISYEDVPTAEYDINERKKEHIEPTPAITGNRGIKLSDVASGKASLDDFVMQMNDTELASLVIGGGMNNPNTRSGAIGSLGGITRELHDYGIPAISTVDGPSGIRIETGEHATLFPNGTSIASSWNDALVEELYTEFGKELSSKDCDILLAPGINIHRNPLNGRNFEYFSEDPYLTAYIALAAVRGVANGGAAATLKHFAANSQEYNRKGLDSVVSERALREIYLFPFEINVKSGVTISIMSAYNLINGIHCSDNYDLCTSILRDEWGYDGFVMTDWGAVFDGNKPEDTIHNLRDMLISQNDIFMTCEKQDRFGHNILTSLSDGTLDRFYLIRSAKNLLKFIMRLPAMDRKRGDFKTK